MALTWNYIDPNTPEGASGAWQHFVLADAGGGTFYALLDIGNGQPLQLYVSTDDTATWSLLNAACPYVVAGNYKLFTQFIDGKLKVAVSLITTGLVPDPTYIINFIDYDVLTDTWSAITNIGGSFEQDSGGGIAAQGCTGLIRFTRQDGSEIVAYQCENSAPTLDQPLGYWQVRFLKLSGSTWSELAVLSNPGAIQYFIMFTGGINPVTDVVDIIVNQPIGDIADPSDYQESNSIHYSIAADDTVSGPHTIDTVEEMMPALSNPNQAQDSTENGRVAYSSDGLMMLWARGRWTNTYPNGDHVEVEIRASIGDLSGDPLNPTWANETVATFSPKNWNAGFSNDVNPSFMDEPVIYAEQFGDISGSGNKVWCGVARHTGAGTGPKVYYGSRVTAGSNNTSKLFWSLRTGVNTWSAPVILFPDPDRDTIHLDGFDIPPPFVETTPLTITCPVTIVGTIGTPYSSSAVADGGVPPYTYAIISGALPDGLSLNASTGEISGTPTVAGVFHFVIQVTDSNGNTAHT